MKDMPSKGAWTDDAIVRLRTEWNARAPTEKTLEFDRRMAKLFRRTVRASQNQRLKHELLDEFRSWTASEDARLREEWAKYVSLEVDERGTAKEFDTKMAQLFGKSYLAAQRRRHDLQPPLKLEQGGTQIQPAPADRLQSRGIRDELSDLDLRDYLFADGSYWFSINGRLYPIPAEEWEWICEQYSAEGVNRTAKEIARAVERPVAVLQTCLRQARQYKASLPVSTETMVEQSVDEIAARTVAAKEKAVMAQVPRRWDRRREQRLVELETRFQAEERFTKMAAEIMGDWRAPVIRKSKKTGGSRDAGPYIAHCPTTDVHFGRLSWGDEVFGGRNMDTSIMGSWYRAYADLSAAWLAARPGRCSKLYLTDIGDILHALLEQTESGTPLAQDSRAQKVWRECKESMIYRIEAHRPVADEIEVIFVPGNHEGATISYLFMDVISTYYQGVQDVKVHVHPRRYAAFRVAGSLHVLDHGKGIGRSLSSWKALAQAEVVAREAAGQDYHGATSIYCYSGHYHERQVSASGRHLEMIRLPALCPADDFETDHRYAQDPQARLFILDDRGRNVDEHVIFAEEIIERADASYSTA